ncbi:MAG: KEOPS complex subunit Cgi121 [Candidatus Thermoplasmatota archaeon]|nr:KEOPS complex subunit Cgi121 [Candidatus Thermoplasmatota archaeon]
MLCRLHIVVLEVGSGRLKEGDITELMSLIGPNFALIESGKVCGPQHLNQSARLAKKAHEGKYNLSKDRSTELLLYLTAQRQISKAIEIAGVNASTKTVAWVAFDQVPARLSDLLEPDESVISHTDFDYSTLGLDEDVLERLDFDEKQKIVMTRTATLPVQSR